MNKIFTLLTLLFIGSSSFGQRLFTDDFNYATGQLTAQAGGANVGGGNWMWTSGTANYLPVVAGTLTYPDYSTGASATDNNKLSLIATSSSAEDAMRGFAAQTSGTVYTTFLLNVADQTRLLENSGTGDFFVAFLGTASTSVYAAGRVYIKKGVAPNTISLGVAVSTTANSGPVVYSPVDYALGTTHLVTLAFTFVQDAGNDEARLFVNRPSTSSEPTPDAISVYLPTSTSENTDVSGLLIRQGANTPNAAIDAIKVSTNYGDATLPLDIISFKGSLIEQRAQLSWTTANEQNVKSFTIERSNEGRTFEAIGVVDAKNGAHNGYSFTDKTPLTNAGYYRLKMTDKDGSFKHSAVILITNRKEISAQIFPNPAHDNITVKHTKAGAGAVIRIVNLAGQQIKSYSIEQQSTQTSLLVNDLHAGNYLLIYQDGSKKTVTKLLKM